MTCTVQSPLLVVGNLSVSPVPSEDTLSPSSTVWLSCATSLLYASGSEGCTSRASSCSAGRWATLCARGRSVAHQGGARTEGEPAAPGRLRAQRHPNFHGRRDPLAVRDHHRVPEAVEPCPPWGMRSIPPSPPMPSAGCDAQSAARSGSRLWYRSSIRVLPDLLISHRAQACTTSARISPLERSTSSSTSPGRGRELRPPNPPQRVRSYELSVSMISVGFLAKT
jgi:hypothetical protein